MRQVQVSADCWVEKENSVVQLALVKAPHRGLPRHVKLLHGWYWSY